MVSKKNGIEYELFEGSTENNINLVFVHGSGCNRTFLRPIYENVTKYNSYFIDLPGHGGSDNTGYSVDNYVKAIIDFINDLDNVILIGHSLGGTLVLKTISENIKCIKAALILSSGASFPKLNKDYMDKIHQGIVDMEYLGDALGNMDDSVVQDVVSKIDPPEIMVTDFLIDEKVDIQNCLNKINIPTTIVTGADEILTLVEYSELLNKEIKNSKLIIIPNVRHMLPVVKRKEVGEILDDIVSQIK